jgi:hypothetical protein
VYDAADVSGWTNWLAGAVQLAALAVLAWLVARRPPPAPAAIALAALGPAVFLVLNRIFSAQFVVTIGAATAIAAALVAAGRRLVATLALLGLASGFNLLVYPITRAWQPASALLFLSLGAAVLAVLVAARRYKPLTNGGYPLRS